MKACPGGCSWVAPGLCSACVQDDYVFVNGEQVTVVIIKHKTLSKEEKKTLNVKVKEIKGAVLK